MQGKSREKGGGLLSGSDVRQLVIKSGARLWQVAERLGVCPQTLSVRLRHDFSEADAEQIRQIVAELAQQRA